MAAARCQQEIFSLHLDCEGAAEVLQAARPEEGQLVRVRPLEEIARTLDARGQLRGTAFAEGMEAYCGRELRVTKKLRRIFDEHAWRMLRVNALCYLDGAVCGGCDFGCSFAWRAEWLEGPFVRPAPPSREAHRIDKLKTLPAVAAVTARFALKKLRRQPPPSPVKLPAAQLAPGDRVRVRSEEEIRGTLDASGRLHGCSFSWGQRAFCGEELTVERCVTRFYDSRRERFVTARNLVSLCGVRCDGSDLPETHGCDRQCPRFFRAEWLEKVKAPPA